MDRDTPEYWSCPESRRDFSESVPELSSDEDLDPELASSTNLVLELSSNGNPDLDLASNEGLNPELSSDENPAAAQSSGENPALDSHSRNTRWNAVAKILNRLLDAAKRVGMWLLGFSPRSRTEGYIGSSLP